MGSKNTPDLFISTREDTDFLSRHLSQGDQTLTRAFSLARDGVTGALGLYIECQGSGNLEIYYEVDPGLETGDDPSGPDWYRPDYGNPVVSDQPSGRLAIPLSAVVGRNIRFALMASGGDLNFLRLRLVVQ